MNEKYGNYGDEMYKEELSCDCCNTGSSSEQSAPKLNYVTATDLMLHHGFTHSSYLDTLRGSKTKKNTEVDKLKKDMKILIEYVKEEIRYNDATSVRSTSSVNTTLQGILEHCEAVLEE